MNTNYFSTQDGLATYAEPMSTEPRVAAWEPVRVDSGTVSISVSDGVSTSSIMDTQSTTVSTLPDDILTIGGVTATRQSFINAGILNEDGTDPQEGTQSDQGDQPGEDHDALFENEIDAINDAVEGIPDRALESLTSISIAVAVGKLDEASIIANITQVTGEAPEVSQARFRQAASAYQQQADHFLAGVGVKDVQAFYEFAKAHHAGELQAALTKQVYGGDMSAYRALAQRWNFKQSGYGSRG